MKEPTGTTILAWRHRPATTKNHGSASQDIELNPRAVAVSVNIHGGGAGGLSDRRPPGNGDQVNDIVPGEPGIDDGEANWTRYVVFTLCHQKVLHEIKIVAKPKDNDFDKTVFDKLNDEYCKARGTWAQVICGFSLWDLKELSVVKVLPPPLTGRRPLTL